MKKTITFSFDSEDGPHLNREHVSSALELLKSFIRPSEIVPDTMHPGVKAIRRIKGNMFSAEDVTVFSAYIRELADRAADRIRALELERDAISLTEATTRRAYDQMIEGISASRELSLRNIEEFENAFQQESAPAMSFAMT